MKVGHVARLVGAERQTLGGERLEGDRGGDVLQKSAPV
jgi:hypothetical protein